MWVHTSAQAKVSELGLSWGPQKVAPTAEVSVGVLVGLKVLWSAGLLVSHSAVQKAERKAHHLVDLKAALMAALWVDLWVA